MTAAVVPASPAAGSPKPTSPRDQALARAAVLQSSDFPTGWTAGPRPDNTRADRILRRIPACKHYQVDLAALRRQPTAAANFVQGNAAVSSSVFVVASARAAQLAYTRLTSAAVSSCLQRFLGTVTAGNITIRGLPSTLQGVSGEPESANPVGDQRAALQILITVAGAGLTARDYVDVEVVRVGRGIAELGFANLGTPLPQGLRETLVSAVVSRLRGQH